VIVSRPVDNTNVNLLVVKNVDSALIKTLEIFAPVLKPLDKGIDPTAKVSSSAKIAPSAHIGPNVVIDDNAEIGDNTVIQSGCRIGENTTIASNTRLDSNVVVYHNCKIGNNCVIQANSTIGSTGFGYTFIEGAHRLIPHNGTVAIEDFVEIGANCCVDRAKFSETRIGAGTKIDNLVQIAHNVTIGKCCLLAAQVAIGGSTRLGDGVVVGGQVGISDNIEIGAGTMIGAKSVVFHDVPAGKQMFGIPANEKNEELRFLGIKKRLPKMVEQLKKLTARIEKLEAAENDKK
jgi:UDP-3-O-[3-hydroxymyristoyl] glucosamine N-acyltransferase